MIQVGRTMLVGAGVAGAATLAGSGTLRAIQGDGWERKSMSGTSLALTLGPTLAGVAVAVAAGVGLASRRISGSAAETLFVLGGSAAFGGIVAGNAAAGLAAHTKAI